MGAGDGFAVGKDTTETICGGVSRGWPLLRSWVIDESGRELTDKTVDAMNRRVREYLSELSRDLPRPRGRSTWVSPQVLRPGQRESSRSTEAKAPLVTALR